MTFLWSPDQTRDSPDVSSVSFYFSNNRQHRLLTFWVLVLLLCLFLPLFLRTLYLQCILYYVYYFYCSSLTYFCHLLLTFKACLEDETYKTVLVTLPISIFFSGFTCIFASNTSPSHFMNDSNFNDYCISAHCYRNLSPHTISAFCFISSVRTFLRSLYRMYLHLFQTSSFSFQLVLVFSNSFSFQLVFWFTYPCYKFVS